MRDHRSFESSDPNTDIFFAPGRSSLHISSYFRRISPPYVVFLRLAVGWLSRTLCVRRNRLLATDFIRLPSKRIYPDYYKIIKRPIALEDIKRKLEGGNYATFEEAKLDFELVFKNAKRFNIKDSQIWKDAKHLHVSPLRLRPILLAMARRSQRRSLAHTPQQKLVIKESNKLTGANEVPEGDDMDGPGADAPGSDGEASADKKKKPPNMIRLLKSRLQKLVDKSDDEYVFPSLAAAMC